LQTSSFHLYIYKVQLLGKPLIVGGKQLPGLCIATLSQIIVEKVPLANDISITYGTPHSLPQKQFLPPPGANLESCCRSNFACDSKSTLFGLSNGHLQVVSWNAEVHGNAYCFCFS
jgi:hypothetical protein